MGLQILIYVVPFSRCAGIDGLDKTIFDSVFRLDDMMGKIIFFRGPKEMLGEHVLFEMEE